MTLHNYHALKPFRRICKNNRLTHQSALVMQYYCQQSIFGRLNQISSKFCQFSHICSRMSDSKAGASKDEHREPKEKETSSSSDSDDDQIGASSNYSKPIDGKSRSNLDCIQEYFKQKLKLSHDEDDGKKQADSKQVLKTVDFQGLVDHWNEKGFKKIITMVGAGISTSAGIPDFRSPNTGLYHNLQKYNLPHPTAVFEINYFRKNPQPFFALAKELYPGNFKPTPCHYFVKLLHEKGLLLRHYTQNIDTLEHIAGIPSEKLVEAHGTFRTNHCLGCRREYSMEWVKEQIFSDNVPTCTKCNGVVKPDIVFFGEDLPQKFYVLPDEDFAECDLLIIMGTSLEVQPFASLVGRPNKQSVRLLINREKVGTTTSILDSRFSFLFSNEALLYDKKNNNKRDVAWLGDCDDGVQELANKVGLGDELKALISREHKKIDEAIKKPKTPEAATNAEHSKTKTTKKGDGKQSADSEPSGN